MSALLRIEGLRVENHTGGVLVEDVDLQLDQGEVLGLIGESGAGKSTIGLAALGYARAGCRITRGRILLDGIDLRALDAVGRRAIRGTRVAYVAQSAAAAFNPSLSIGAQVCEGPIRHGLMSVREAHAHAVELFTALDLPRPTEFGRRYPHQVSGGQLQRAMTAMAIACQPAVLVLDEPTTALDAGTQIEVLALLKRLIARYDMAALYVSHDLAVVAQIADRLMVLRHGRIVESESTAVLLRAPRTAYARALITERGSDAAAGPGGAPAGTPFVRGTAPGSAHHGTPGVADPPPAAPAKTAPAVLEVAALVVSYGRRDVVKAATFALARGETLAVVGASGSGKTTLGNAVCGQTAARAGALRFAGVALAAHYSARSREQLRRIQWVTQSPDMALNPRHSIGLIIGRPLSFYFGLQGDALQARVAELLTLVGLDPQLKTRRSGQLSGGQKQRVCIARALAAQPDLLVCDEVTSALDPLVADDILRLLRRLQSELGTAYLYITHDLASLRRIADRVIVMQNGDIVASGSVADVLDRPSHPYLRTLLESLPQLRTDWLNEVLAAR